MTTPDRETFISLAHKGNLIPVFREMMADRLTPVSAFERLVGSRETSAAGNPSAFLLESVEGGERIGRYSYLGSNPSLVFRSKGSRATITRNGAAETREIPAGQDPLTLLKEIMGAYRYVKSDQLPRFCGGAVGFLGYDVVRFFEQLPDANPDELNVDDACFLFTDTLVVFDHVRHRILLVCNAFVENEDAGTAYDKANETIAGMYTRLTTPAPPPVARAPGGKIAIRYHTAQADYEAAVEKSREYILAGDAFQIVLSQRISVDFTAQPFDLYRALRSVNPSPYMFYLDMGDRKIIGGSPEILVTAEQGKVRSRPIAGTRPRGASAAEDARLEKELLADDKERAEHIMLVDLSRNDIGRVCTYGTVRVKELMVIERYSHVMHIVSDVVGELRPDKDAFDVLRATFPHGTVSGAPKVRAMEIIDELETTRRGFYAGCAGYISYAGGMDMAITIRTMMVDGQTAYLQAGAGLVADSSPPAEYTETINKARALITAIEMAEAGLD